MASPSIPMPFPKTQKRARARLATHVLSMKAVIIVFVVLFILFLWLHFILAMDITATHRQIEIKTKELNRLKRDSGALRRRIADIESLGNMSTRAEKQNYILQEPLYLILTQPLPPADDAQGLQTYFAIAVPENKTPTAQSPFEEILVGEPDTWLESDPAP